jgi:hypothetical protein
MLARLVQTAIVPLGMRNEQLVVRQEDAGSATKCAQPAQIHMVSSFQRLHSRPRWWTVALLAQTKSGVHKMSVRQIAMGSSTTSMCSHLTMRSLVSGTIPLWISDPLIVLPTF